MYGLIASDCEWGWRSLFAVLNLCNTYNLGNIARFNYSVFTHKLKVHVACDLNFTVKREGLLKVTGSHVHWKSSNISGTVLDRDVITTGH